jgi:hypothetical protein
MMTKQGLRIFPGKVLSLIAHDAGYKKVNLWGAGRKTENAFVHRLVLEAFKGPAPIGYIARHRDNVRSHNIPDNLEWGTYADNETDKVRHGTFALRGYCYKKPASRKLTPEQVESIKDSKQFLRVIAGKYNMSIKQIWRIRTGRAQHAA